MSESDDSTRPLSVAELLARNGTIGSPPVGGRRRRRRRNSDGLSVAELTGEIPVIQTGEIPVVTDEESDDDAVYDEASDDDGVYDDETVTYDDGSVVTYDDESVVTYDDTAVQDAAVSEGVVYGESSETVVVYTSAEIPEYASEYTAGTSTEYAAHDVDEDVVDEVAVDEVVVDEVVVDEVEVDFDEVAVEAVAVEAEAEAVVVAVEPLPLASDPLPHRSDGPQRSHDPRPVRRSSGAEQMAYDPVDESVNLDDLVEEHVEDVEQLRSYLSASQDTLFSGGTVADDLARGGTDFGDDLEYETDQAVATLSGPAKPRQVGSALWNGVLAVVQSLIAVVFGAALFIGFDQLWRWNNLVALILSVLVVLTLAAAVRYVRKTEDIVSTLTAVAVGLLVTLGPLALQST